MSDFKFAIWDFDGTIADSMDIWVNSASNYLRSKGIENAGHIDEIARPKGLMETALCMKQHFELEETPEQIVDEISFQVGEQYRTEIALKPGVKEIIEELAAQGIRMCIATASTPEHVWAALSRWQLAEYFEFIITCDDVGAGKYSPLIYQQAAERMGAEPHQALVFEDGLMGIISAAKAGFFVIGIYEEATKDRTAEAHAKSHIYLRDWSCWQGFEKIVKSK